MRLYLDKKKTLSITYKEDGTKFPFTLKHGMMGKIHLTHREAHKLSLFIYDNVEIKNETKKV